MLTPWPPDEGPALVEPVPIADTVTTGLARLEKLPGGWVRAVLYVDQRTSDGVPERVLVSRLVGPAPSLRRVLIQMLALLDEIDVTSLSYIPH